MTIVKDEEVPNASRASMLRPPTPRSASKVPALDLGKLDSESPAHAGRDIARGSVTPRSSRVTSPSPRSSSPYQRSPSGHRSVPSSPRGWASVQMSPRAPMSARSSSTTPRGGAANGILPDGVRFSMDKMQSDLTGANKSLRQKELEIKTLLSKVRDSTTALGKKSKDCETLLARALAAEQRQAMTLKEYETLKADHVKLGNQFSGAERKLDKLVAKAANAPAGPDMSIITKDLQSEITELKRVNKQLEGQVKARDNVVRAKDKELSHMELKVGEMESVKDRLGESENQCLYLKQQLEDLREDVKTVLHVQQKKDSDIKQLTGKLSKMELRMSEKEEECNNLRSQVDLAHCDIYSLETEIHVTSESLYRTEQVAARVARFEHDDGLHGDGTVPYQYFANETSYLKGEIKRLRTKLMQRGTEDPETDNLDSSYWTPEDSQDLSSIQNSEQPVEAN